MLDQPVMHLQYGKPQEDKALRDWLNVIPDNRALSPSVEGGLIYIIVGEGINSFPLTREMLDDIEDKTHGVANLAGVFITTHGSTLATTLEQAVCRYLPYRASLQIRVVDSDVLYGLEVMKTWEPCISVPSSPSATTSSNVSSSTSHSPFFWELTRTSVVTCSNCLTDSTVVSKVIQVPRLTDLTVRGPLHPGHQSLHGYYCQQAREAFIKLLSSPGQTFRDVRRVVITLDFIDELSPILEELRALKRMTTLELTSFSIPAQDTVLKRRKETYVTLEKGVENLTQSQLDELILPVELMDFATNTFRDLLKRVFRLHTRSKNCRTMKLSYKTPGSVSERPWPQLLDDISINEDP